MNRIRKAFDVGSPFAQGMALTRIRDDAEWIKDCTAKISNAIGGGSELFTRHGEEFRLDVDFVCKRISEMRERQHKAMRRAIQAERALKESAK